MKRSLVVCPTAGADTRALHPLTQIRHYRVHLWWLTPPRESHVVLALGLLGLAQPELQIEVNLGLGEVKVGVGRRARLGLTIG